MSRSLSLLLSFLASFTVHAAYAEDQAPAPQIEVNQGQWSQLSDEEKAQIESVLSQSFPGQKFAFSPTPGAAVAAVPKPTVPQCKLVCQVGGTVAGAACGALPPLASAICFAATPEVQKICEGACDRLR